MKSSLVLLFSYFCAAHASATCFTIATPTVEHKRRNLNSIICGQHR